MYVHGFPGVSVVKNLPARQETWVGSLGWEDRPGKDMGAHSRILAWEIPWTEDPGSYSPQGHRLGHSLVPKQQQQQQQCTRANSKLLNHPPTHSTSPCFLCLKLCFCSVNKFICIIFKNTYLLGCARSLWQCRICTWDPVSWPGTEPRAPAVGTQSLSH